MRAFARSFWGQGGDFGVERRRGGGCVERCAGFARRRGRRAGVGGARSPGVRVVACTAEATSAEQWDTFLGFAAYSHGRRLACRSRLDHHVKDPSAFVTDGIDFQGSCAGRALPCCSSSMLAPSGVCSLHRTETSIWSCQTPARAWGAACSGSAKQARTLTNAMFPSRGGRRIT